MHQAEKDLQLPLVTTDTTLHNTLFVMTSGRLGMAVIVDDNNKVVGIFTDGDLRRCLEKKIDLETPMSEIMTPNPKQVSKTMRASDALSLMNEKAISQLLIVDDEQQLEGVISIHDLLQAGVS